MRDAQHAVQLNEISQIALTVSDLKRAQGFYQNTLGMKFLFEAGTMVFFQCGSIRLMIGAAKETAVGGTIVYFKVQDIRSVRESLKGQEVEFIGEPNLVAMMQDHDLWMAFLKD